MLLSMSQFKATYEISFIHKFPGGGGDGNLSFPEA